MPRCHNCGRETMRTEDWSCQWCGYPIVSGSFKKIEKTYRQLKEERLRKPEEEPVPELEIEQEPVPEPEPEPETESEIEQIEISEPVSEEKPEKEEGPKEEREPEEEEEPMQEPGPESEIGQEIKPEKGVPDETEAVIEPEPEVEVEIEIEKEIEQEPAPVPESEPEPELESAAEELNVTELFKAYEAGDVAADERFANKILRITGVVSLIDVKNISDTHYIRLAASEGDLMQSVQCMFDKKHAPVLSQMERGQVVTVQGRYSGSMIAMRLVDCVLIV